MTFWSHVWCINHFFFWTAKIHSGKVRFEVLIAVSWGFKMPGRWWCVSGWFDPDISKDCLWNVISILPSNTTSHPTDLNSVLSGSLKWDKCCICKIQHQLVEWHFYLLINAYSFIAGIQDTGHLIPQGEERMKHRCLEATILSIKK
jgi:hypothetical protein